MIYNSEAKLQRFFPINDDSDAITAITVSSNKKLLAIAERGKKGYFVSIWDLIKYTKKKTIFISDAQSEPVCSLSFCADAKLLLVQTGKPDWHLSLWNWDKNKTVSL